VLVLVCLLVDSLVSCISNLHIVLNSDLGGGAGAFLDPLGAERVK